MKPNKQNSKSFKIHYQNLSNAIAFILATLTYWALLSIYSFGKLV